MESGSSFEAQLSLVKLVIETLMTGMVWLRKARASEEKPQKMQEMQKAFDRKTHQAAKGLKAQHDRKDGSSKAERIKGRKERKFRMSINLEGQQQTN